jgi:hypothetical protein
LSQATNADSSKAKITLIPSCLILGCPISNLPNLINKIL